MKPSLSIVPKPNTPPDGEFRSLGEFLAAAHAAATGSTPDKRLVRAARAANENDPTAGGFMVPEVYASRIIGSIYEEAVIAPLCDLTEMAGPVASIKEPCFSEDSRIDSSRWGGSLGYWLAESVSVPPSRPKFRMNEYSPHKLIILCQVTDELFRDNNMIEAHFTRAMKAEGAFQLDRAILTGTGVGVPLGLLAAPATITIAKDSGQASATITGSNINNMFARLPLPCRRRAVWLVSEDVDAQLETIGNASGAALYVPQGAAGNAYPLLKGRPVLAIEQASALGTVGDIFLADLSLYRLVQSPPKFAMSADVAFDSHEMVFRFTLRVDGRPAYASAVTPFNGAATRSPYITLAAR